MSSKAIRWLLGELPGLVKSNVISEESATRLREHYEPLAVPRRAVALLVSGVIGSVLIGAGVILLFAHNWSGLPRWLRTVLAIAPLASVQALGAWGISKGKSSTAWRESIGVLVFLLIASSIALVGQTYHIPGDLGGFLTVWMLLALPLIYILDVSLVCVCYFAGITCWAGYMQECGGHASLFWLLLALAIPHMWSIFRRDPESPRVALEGWALAACLAVAVGVVMERCLPGLWIVVYAGMFAIFYLVGTYWFRRSEGLFHNPFQTIGACGTAGLALLLTFEWPWDEIGWRYYRFGLRYHEWAAIPEYLVAAVLPLVAIVMAVTAIRRRRPWEMMFGFAPVVAVLGYCIVAGWRAEIAAAVLYNAYALLLGIACVVIGVHDDRALTVNGGIVVLAILIVARFFDVELSFISRGIVFIVIGVVFLGANVVMVRRRGRSQRKEVAA